MTTCSWVDGRPGGVVTQEIPFIVFMIEIEHELVVHVRVFLHEGIHPGLEGEDWINRL